MPNRNPTAALRVNFAWASHAATYGDGSLFAHHQKIAEAVMGRMLVSQSRPAPNVKPADAKPARQAKPVREFWSKLKAFLENAGNN